MQILTRTELNSKFNINQSQWTRRHDDLLEHLQEYMDIVETKSGSRTYSYIITGELPDKIPPLPRKNNKQQKIEDYEQYVQNQLSEYWQPTSKTKMAREAIKEFGKGKYGHKNGTSIARIYTGPAMDKYGEHTDYTVWVDYNTYEYLSIEEIDYLKECFHSVGLTQKHMAESYKMLKMGDDSASRADDTLFQRVREMFIEKYGKMPIVVNEWRAKQKREEMRQQAI